MIGLVFVSIAVVSMASIMYYLIDHEWEIPAEYLFFTLGCVANTVMTWLFNLCQSESMKYLYTYAYTTMIEVKLHFSWPWFKNFEKRASEVGVHQITIDAIRNLQGGENFDKSSFRWNGDLLFDVNKFFNSPMMEVYMELQKNDIMLPFIIQYMFVKVLWLYIHFDQTTLDKQKDAGKSIVRYITIYVCLNSSDRYKYFDKTVMAHFEKISTRLEDIQAKYGLDIVHNHLNGNELFYRTHHDRNSVYLHDDKLNQLFDNFKENHTTVRRIYRYCINVNIYSNEDFLQIKFN